LFQDTPTVHPAADPPLAPAPAPPLAAGVEHPANTKAKPTTSNTT
jgi:hypothetical protein